jgi:hypothetical protein
VNSLQRIIDANNKKHLTPAAPDPSTTRQCNCTHRDQFPLDRKCKTDNIIYQCTVTTTDKRETYIGWTANTFKTRFGNHKSSFKNKKQANATELSKYVWQLKDSGKQYQMTWTIVCRASPYSNITKRCNLCVWEKYYITYRRDMASLNKRSELVSSCRHSSKFLLKNS